MDTFGNIKDYWEWAHSTKNMSSLTGSKLDDHLGFLDIPAQLPPSVLCIGVGDGGWIRQAAERVGRKVYAIDISQTALDGVADIAHGFTPATFAASNTLGLFDVALSLWVAPHMRKSQLADQMKFVVPALKADGVFAVHYNEPLRGTTFSEAEHIAKYPSETEALRAGLFRMTKAEFEALADAAGGRVTRHAEVIDAVEYGETLCRAHVRRAR